MSTEKKGFEIRKNGGVPCKYCGNLVWLPLKYKGKETTVCPKCSNGNVWTIKGEIE